MRKGTDSESFVVDILCDCDCTWCFWQIGDKELEEFLKEEIQMEKKQQKSSSGKLPKIKGFEITKSDGPNVTLSKKFENEVYARVLFKLKLLLCM